jgi:hypothetical protein
MRDEDLGAVQHEVITLVHRDRLGAARVGPGARLGQPESAQHLPCGEQGDEPAFLLVRAEVDDRRCAERGMGADRDGVTGVDLGELVDDEDIGEVVHAGAAQLLGPGNAEQPQVGHAPHIVPGELTVVVILTRAGPHDLLREVAHHVADLEVVVREIQGVVHTEI